MTKNELESICKIKVNISKAIKDVEAKQEEKYSDWLISNLNNA
ncbi:hypothetical protein [Spiroplasma endosymbiont of Labia minor]